MSKNKDIHELTNLLAVALRHRIGAIVNSNELYAQKYAKDADILMKEAQKAAARKNWNSHDKREIREELRIKLMAELTSRDFLDARKFDIMDKEMDRALREMGLDG